MLETLKWKFLLLVLLLIFKILTTGSGAATDLGNGAFCSEYGWSFQAHLAPGNEEGYDVKRSEIISLWPVWCTNPSLVSFSLLSASGEEQPPCETFSPSLLNSSIRGKSVTIATTTETCQLDTLIPAGTRTHRPLFFVRLWRMVACTRALLDQVWWRLLRSSINHAPDMERNCLWSTSVSWRTLHIVQKWSNPLADLMKDHGGSDVHAQPAPLAVTSDLTRPSSRRRKSRSRCRTCRILDCSASVRWLRSRGESPGSPSIPHWSTKPRHFSRELYLPVYDPNNSSVNKFSSSI